MMLLLIDYVFYYITSDALIFLIFE